MINKPLTVMVLCFGIMTGLHSQPPAPVILPNGDTKTTTTSVDPVNGSKITVDEYKDKAGIPKGFKTTTVDITGKTEVRDSITTASGRPRRVTVTRTDGNGKTTYAEERNYDSKGKEVVERQTRTYTSTNIILVIQNKGAMTTSGLPTVADPGPLPPKDEGQSKTLSMKGKVDASLDYSYLNAATSGDNISFPLGVHLSGTYYIKDKLGLVLDASYHTKKDMDFRTSRSFLMAGAQYALYTKEQKDEERVMLIGRIVAGLASDRQKYLGAGNSDPFKVSAFAAGAGLGLLYPVCRNLHVQLSPDYIATNFNDDWQSNWRFSLGGRFRF